MGVSENLEASCIKPLRLRLSFSHPVQLGADKILRRRVTFHRSYLIVGAQLRVFFVESLPTHHEVEESWTVLILFFPSRILTTTGINGSPFDLSWSLQIRRQEDPHVSECCDQSMTPSQKILRMCSSINFDHILPLPGTCTRATYGRTDNL